MHDKKTDLSTAAGPTVLTIGAPPTPKVEVPWSAEALKGRECRTCACYFEQANAENPTQIQGFCRRLPADMAKVRMMEPRKDLKGNFVMRDGAPVMQPTEVVGYIFKPTRREGTCFDGWRPIDTLPGERPIDVNIRQLRHRLVPVLADMPKEFRPFLAAMFGLDTEETRN